MKLLIGLAALAFATNTYAKVPYIEIDLSERKLTYYADSTHTYNVAVGKIGHSTPQGEFIIQTIEKNPAWCPKPTVKWLTPEQKTYVNKHGCILYGNPLNPLANYRLRFDGVYSIHGTTNTFDMKRQKSHGCIRMRPKDISELVEKLHLQKKTPVIIHQ